MKIKHNRNRRGEDIAPIIPTAEKPSRITRALDIPSSALGGMPQVELSGNREAVVDGCQGVLEYDENVIKLATGKMSIKFIGRNLQIKVLTHDSAIVDGFITGIEFIT